MHAGGQRFDPAKLHHYVAEVYPSPAEGIGLENRQGMKVPRGFESLNLRHLNIAGWSSLVARRAHNPKVVGSNPAPAIMVVWSNGYDAALSRRRFEFDSRYDRYKWLGSSVGRATD